MIFTEFMHFPTWAMKQDRPNFYYKMIDGSTFNRDDFIKEADISRNGNLIQFATLLHYLDDILGGNRKRNNSFHIRRNFGKNCH